MALHRILFDSANPADSSNLGAYLRIGSTGKLASYSSVTEAGSVVFNFVDGDVTVGSDSIAESAHGLELGDVVVLTTSGVLPAGLSLATNYWAIRVDANNFKLASSLANAEAGTAVDITAAAGGGTHTVTQQERVHAALDMNIVNTLSISATDLDIRDLVFATDKVDVSGSEVSLDAATLAALENITVSASDLDIRDLVAASDSVAAWVKDGSGNSISSTSGALDVNIANAGDINVELTHNTAIQADAKTVTTTGALVDSVLANREMIWIYNNGSKAIYIGPSGVSISTGFPVPVGAILEAKIGAAVAIHAVAESGSQDIRLLQAS